MSVTFLNSTFLWFLPVTALPILVHLFLRRRPRKTEFSDLRFIKDALKRIQTRFKLRNYLLLLVRALILLLLVLYFARPLLRFGASDSDKGSALSVVLMLDASYSMRYMESGIMCFERGKQLALRLLELLPPEARIGALVYSDRVEAATPGLGNDRRYLAQLIGAARPTNRTTDAARAFASAEQLLSGAEASNKTVIVISDLAAHGFAATAGLKDKRIRVISFAPEDRVNSFLSGARMDFEESEERWAVTVQGKVGRSESSGENSLSYVVNGQKKGSDFAHCADDGSFSDRLQCGREETDVAGYVELASDRLPEDNRFYFAARRPALCRTWIIDGDPRFGGSSAESYYLRTAFPVSVVVTEAEAETTDFRVPGTVILANTRDEHPRVEQFIKAGGGAILFPGSHSSEVAVPPYFPAEIGTAFKQRLQVRWSAGEHELSSRVSLAGFDADKIAVDEGYVLRPKEGTTVFAALASGWPFMVEGAYGRGKVMLFASSAGRQWNNLPTRPLFAPFMRGLAGYLSAAPQSRENVMLAVGEPFRKAGIDGAEIEVPSGRRAKMRVSGSEALFQETDEPGIYRVLLRGEELMKFAVNMDTGSGESDIAPVSASALKRFLAGNTFVMLPVQNWEKRLAIVLSGVDVTRIIILLVLFLALVEVILSNPKVSVPLPGERQ